jgi:anthranilate phosphoribosyltransferase
MSEEFREFVKKIGSGAHTGKHLTRQEAARAMELMLAGIATPAQIGAFLIAHRIVRPTGEELAGMADTLAAMGPALSVKGSQLPVVLGIPYDGRSRTTPMAVLTGLLLAAAAVPVILHGGDRMPTKYGVPLVEIWQGLGVDWRGLDLAGVQDIFDSLQIGFIYTPTLFPATNLLAQYRAEIGKRPPLASLELMWCPCTSDVHLMLGYVHPPTETFILDALSLRNYPSRVTTIKGLEGSIDLPFDRVAIYLQKNCANGGDRTNSAEIERAFLHSRDVGLGNVNPPLESIEATIVAYREVLTTASGKLFDAALWNGGFALWQTGVASDLSSGISLARQLYADGTVNAKLQAIVDRCRGVE